mmetsp:Transcript_33911/g.72401  ORF Transcript_33911/g.72401 Transcript_33911/m.72401 type:complete len:344 (-) Transcript_33911:263-1294(-)
MPPLSYAKWDAMEFDEDEDEEPRKPRVTRLEGPSTITIGPQRPTAQPAAPAAPVRPGIDYSRWDKIVMGEEDEEDEDTFDDDGEGEYEMDHQAVYASAQGDDSQMQPRPCTEREYDEADAEARADAHETDDLDAGELMQLHQVYADKGMPLPSRPDGEAAFSSESEIYAALVAMLSRNGANCGEYLWRQTEREVEISVLVPPGTRAKDLTPALLHPTTFESKQRVVLGARATAQPFFERVLAYPVEQPEDDTDLTWEVTDFEPLGGRRVLRLTLNKQEMHGVVIWWTRAFNGETELDPSSAFPDRKRAAKAADHQAVWEQAQQMFKESVAARSAPQHIDVCGQ